MKTQTQLVPLLVVRGAARAIEFYVGALGAKVLARQRVEQLSVEEIQRQRDELFARVSASAPAPEPTPPPGKDKSTLDDRAGARQHQNGTARIHLVIGPVGAGKSTFGRRLAREHAAVRLTLDEWMSELFSPDRPETGVIEWYVERAARTVDRIWSVAKDLLDLGTGVVLEIGLLKRSERESFFQRVDDAGHEMTTHVLDASRQVRRERVAERNRVKGPTFAMVVPPAIFELASDLWEPLDPSECEGRDVRFVRTDVD